VKEGEFLVLRFIMFVSVTLLLPNILLAESWNKVADKDGIIVYTRDSHDSDIKEFKVQMVVESSLSGMVAVIDNISDYLQWYKYVSETRVLERINEREQIFYMETLVPVLKNRDVILRMKMEQNPTTKAVIATVEEVSDYLPAKKGLVRMPISRGHWIITPQYGGTLSVEQQMLVDPGGTIPAWIVNPLLAGGPLESFQKLRDLVMLEKNQGVELSWIEER